jgi:hypothetical protein
MLLTMKVFIGLVLGAIAIGLLLTAAAVAFVVPVSVSVEAVEEDIGLRDVTAYPREDLLGIQVRFTWKTPRPDTTTFVLERSLTGNHNTWENVVTIEPGSRHYVGDETIEYLDEDVEHMVTYHYRIQMSDSAGGSGMSYVVEATAADPAR